LLANIYMNRFLKHFRQSGAADAFRAHVVAYADDLVILSRGRAAEALTWMRDAMAKLGLNLNEAKTSLKDATPWVAREVSRRAQCGKSARCVR
jgi:RNA-directed DNA polymerase